jgi:hypothetical protein
LRRISDGLFRLRHIEPRHEPIFVAAGMPQSKDIPVYFQRVRRILPTWLPRFGALFGAGFRV